MSLDTVPKEFEPGTTGWTADDLDDPEIEAKWFAGHYEIVEGVLTIMPPAFFDSTLPFGRFIYTVQRFLNDAGIPGDFGPETDYIVAPIRVARVDMVFVTPEDLRKNIEEKKRRGRKHDRLRFPPTLAIECISQGHENHDRETKRRWYAEAGVPNYWIFDAFGRSVESLVLKRNVYRRECIARGDQEFRPSLFPGLAVPLKSIWFSVE